MDLICYVLPDIINIFALHVGFLKYIFIYSNMIIAVH